MCNNLLDFHKLSIKFEKASLRKTSQTIGRWNIYLHFIVDLSRGQHLVYHILNILKEDKKIKLEVRWKFPSKFKNKNNISKYISIKLYILTRVTQLLYSKLKDPPK